MTDVQPPDRVRIREARRMDALPPPAARKGVARLVFVRGHFCLGEDVPRCAILVGPPRSTCRAPAQRPCGLGGPRWGRTVQASAGEGAVQHPHPCRDWVRAAEAAISGCVGDVEQKAALRRRDWAASRLGASLWRDVSQNGLGAAHDDLTCARLGPPGLGADKKWLACGAQRVGPLHLHIAGRFEALRD